MPTSDSAHPATAAALYEAAVGERVRRLAVIGLAKNVGKTVTLGALAAEAGRRGKVLGLCSTGRDGERRDAVTELPKPAIWGSVGALVATAAAAVGQGSARLDVLERLPFTTHFGQVIIGRVAQAGTLLLLGPGTASRLAAVLERLEALGATLCLVDGSLDRLAAAAPGVTEAAAVATGAAQGHTPEAVARQTGLALDVLRLPGVEPGYLRAQVEVALDGARAVTLLEGEAAPGEAAPAEAAPLTPRPLSLATAAGAAGAILAAVTPATQAIVLGGALPAGLIQALSLRGDLCRQLTLITRDATRVFPEPLDWLRFRRQGGSVRVLHPIDLRAVTCNPWSPTGPALNEAAMHAAITRAASPIPTFDVVAGLGAPALPPSDRVPAPDPAPCKEDL
ncbi:MAG: lysine 5,6-aminomutase reactivase subunit KamB [Symbiobacteriia bacterium]